MTLGLLLIGLFFLSLPVESQEASPVEEKGTVPLIDLLGMDLESAYGALGAPSMVFSHRGEEEWEDDVVFYYENHIYLFWFRNKVYQVRVDERYAHDFFGLRMGIPKIFAANSLRKVGKFMQEVDNSIIFHLIGYQYPLRVRAIFQQGVLNDFYIYRSDF